MATSQHTFHFISGLPRSGSTLLSAILRQNPRFHCGVTSPVASFFSAIVGQVSVGSEWAPQVSTEQRRTILHGLFESYYAGNPQPVIFDTNRVWSAKLPAILDLFPEARMIACVRNVAWIMDSIERLYRANPYENTRLFANEAERSTVFSRVETLAQRTRLVGIAWAGLKEAFYSAQGKAMLVIDYDILAQRPKEVITLIYSFLGEQPFEHDYQNIAFDTPDYDEGLGLAGLHKVRPQVQFEARKTILPPDLFEQYAKLSFWHDTTLSQTNVIRIRDQG